MGSRTSVSLRIFLLFCFHLLFSSNKSHCLVPPGPVYNACDKWPLQNSTSDFSFPLPISLQIKEKIMNDIAIYFQFTLYRKTLTFGEKVILNY